MESHPINFQAFITFALVAVASAAPQYAPVVHAVAGYAAPDLAEPSPYTYTYAVADDYSKNSFAANENRDGYAASGEYRVALPDGRTQIVSWSVSADGGYVADVKYEGSAVYPEYVPNYPGTPGYHAAPAYKPAPAPAAAA